MRAERERDVFYTVGHSNRGADALVALLASAAIGALIDVRRFPSSRMNPQFNRGPLGAELARRGIDYAWRGETLGGRREHGERATPRGLAAALRGYAAHMEGESFLAAIDELVARGRTERLALLCAERDPMRCHRSLIADHLVLLRGLSVLHLVEIGAILEHVPHPDARVAGGRLVYGGATQLTLGL
jgi:uncharacterized protein (DUF488 family)